MVICLERDADLHMAQLMLLPLTVLSCFSKIQIGFTFLVVPEKGLLNGCVCVCVCHNIKSMARYLKHAPYSCRLCLVIMCKHDVIHKTESTSQCRQRRTEPRP